MMIVMVGNEKSQVDQPHRRPQPGVQRRPFQDSRIRCEKQRYELHAETPKLGKEVIQATCVVIGLVSTTVGQISRRELWLIGENLPAATQPERFKIDEVADVFLDRPTTFVRRGQRGGGYRARPFLEARGSAAQSLDEAGEPREGEREIEGPLEPPLWAHSECVGGV